MQIKGMYTCKERREGKEGDMERTCGCLMSNLGIINCKKTTPMNKVIIPL
mgnify:FL=1